jgi:hypothetical protein
LANSCRWCHCRGGSNGCSPSRKWAHAVDTTRQASEGLLWSKYGRR